MEYNEALRQALALHSLIFPDENSFLHHIFFVNGNGLEWVNGQLIDPFETGTFEERLQKQAPKIAEMLALRWSPPSKINRKMIYPICKYAKILHIPSNVAPDWLKAAKKALAYSKKLRRTKEDRRWLKMASERIKTLSITKETNENH